jgi:hypothetical protein
MHEFFSRKFTKSRAGALRGNDALILPLPKIQYVARRDHRKSKFGLRHAIKLD